MPTYRENGLSISWDAGDVSAAAPGRLTVLASPAHPSNVLKVLYSVDGGAERMARGFPLDSGVGGDPQRFSIELPLLPAGSAVAWRPVLSCSGREADPRRGGLAAETLRPATPPFAPPAPSPVGPAPRFPNGLQFLARVTAPLEHRPRVLGETPDGLRIVYPIGHGGVVRGPRLNGTILHKGGDWMRIRRDGIGVPEVRVLIETDKGALVMGEYSGVVDFGPDGYAALASNRPPARAWTQLAPRYVTSAPDLLWLNRLQCVAFGWVTMATLLVEYDLYAMQPGPAGAGGTPHGG